MRDKLMSEEEIRETAHKRNDKGRDKTFPSRDKLYKAKKGSRLLGDKLFRDRVASHIDSIPLDPAKLKHCPACESVLCGLCGKCHEFDRKSFHVGPTCPISQHMHQDDLCVAWSYAYIFLQDAIKQEECDIPL
jgi:hypothetical protein